VTKPELTALLAGEIERRLPDIESGDAKTARNALHALRGASAMAGQGDLSLVIAHFSARLRGGDQNAASQIGDILRDALSRLKAGERPFETRWPTPPPGLGPSKVDPKYRSEYLAAAHDRLAELHAALDADKDLVEAFREALRAVHSLKGAAGSIGDDATTWYCHGLEARLRAADQDELRQRALDDLPRHASAIALLVEDPVAALETLRGSAPRASQPPSATRRPSSAPGHSAPPPASRRAPAMSSDEDTGEHTVRVQGVSLDRVLDRLERLQLVHDDLGGLSQSALGLSQSLHDQRVQLHDALRLLGPSRPWGPPAAALQRVEAVARQLDSAAQDLAHVSELGRAGVERMRAASGDIRREIGSVRRASLSTLIMRVATSIERIAARDGRNVRVRVVATDAPIDREVAERLVDPLMQLARNALAHGIEPPAERIGRGKDPIGTLSFTAERRGDWMLITCEDDGRGVNMDAVRQAAVERELVSADAARTASDDELLGLLFVPGMTTRPDADLLAGRGVGLDLALSLIRRIGGSIHLTRHDGRGLTATIQVPSERWMTDVLWIRAGDFSLALPVTFTGRLERTDPDRPPVHLCRCLGVPAPGPPAYSLEIALAGVSTVSIGIDAVGEVEECSLRPLPSAIAASGPFSGAIVRGDGALHLALDATLLAVRAWTLA